jgi:hypothetical protein
VAKSHKQRMKRLVELWHEGKISGLEYSRRTKTVSGGLPELDVSVQVDRDTARGFQQELMQILRGLNLADNVKIEVT